jgi:hypothetical protein
MRHTTLGIDTSSWVHDLGIQARAPGPSGLVPDEVASDVTGQCGEAWGSRVAFGGPNFWHFLKRMGKIGGGGWCVVEGFLPLYMCIFG